MIDRHNTTWMGVGLTLTLLLALGLFVLLPLGALVANGLPRGAEGIDGLQAALLAAPLQQGLVNSLGVALLACGLASLIAIPLALVAVRWLPPVRQVVSLLGLIPLAMPPFLGAALLDHFSSIYNASAGAGLFGSLHVRGSGIALGAVYALHYFPFILFCLMTGLDRIERPLEESARNLGAGPLTLWRRVLLPLATPGFLAGAALVILRIVEDIGAPLVLDIDEMLAPQVLRRLGQAGPADPELQAVALTLCGVALVVTALAWSALQPPPVPDKPGTADGRRGARGLVPLMAMPMLPVLLLITLAPLIWLVLLALGAEWSGGLLPTDYRGSGTAPTPDGAGGSASLTLWLALATGLVTLLLALVASVAGASRSLLARLARFGATAMFAIPGIVLALGYLQVADGLSIELRTDATLALAALGGIVAFKQLPLAQRILLEPMRRLRAGVTDAARGLGAAGPGLYWRIHAPMLGGALGAVFLLGAVAVTLELSAALVLIENPDRPYLLVLFHQMQAGAAAAQWATQGILLWLATGMALVAALLLLRGRTRSPGSVRPAQPLREKQ